MINHEESETLLLHSPSLDPFVIPCESLDCSLLSTPDAAELQQGEFRLTVAMPRLRKAGQAPSWERASFLPDAACLNVGITPAMLGLRGFGGTLLLDDEQFPTQAHFENHHFVHFGAITWPEELVELTSDLLVGPFVPPASGQ